MSETKRLIFSYTCVTEVTSKSGVIGSTWLSFLNANMKMKSASLDIFDVLWNGQTAWVYVSMKLSCCSQLYLQSGWACYKVSLWYSECEELQYNLAVLVFSVYIKGVKFALAITITTEHLIPERMYGVGVL